MPDDAFRTFFKQWVLLTLGAIQVAIFVILIDLTRIPLPFWDMLSFIDEYLIHRQAGTYLAYLWLPDSEHHSVWSRLFTIIDLEVFDGNGPSFQLFRLSCLLSGLLAFCLEIGRSSMRRDMLTLTCMLFLTVPAAVDCAVPMNGCYVEATSFVVLSLVLLDGHGEEGTHPLARRLAALIAAMAASFGNAVGLLAWPLLVWSAWRGRLCWRWQVGIFAFGVGFIMLYLVHLMAGSTVPSNFAVSAHLLKVADYALAFAGLPWTRAPALAMSGRIVGAVLLICSLAVVIYHGWLAPLLTRFERICTGLIVFSLGTVVLAALGRVDLATAVVVPVRYAVLLAPMHVGLLGLMYAALPKSYYPTAHAVAVVLASLLLGLQIPAANAAVQTSRDITVLVQRFLVGEWDERMQSTVFPDLTKAERIFFRIDQQGLYQWLPPGRSVQRSLIRKIDTTTADSPNHPGRSGER